MENTDFSSSSGTLQFGKKQLLCTWDEAACLQIPFSQCPRVTHTSFTSVSLLSAGAFLRRSKLAAVMRNSVNALHF